MEKSKGFAAVAGRDARVLILGSLPGQISLRKRQYYGHPRNVFWPIMQSLYGIRGSYRSRCQSLVENGIALWDVLDESERPGSLDADIRVASARANDFRQFLSAHQSLCLIAFNGKKAQQLFHRLVRLPPSCEVEFVGLPSSSPAYAGMSTAAKVAAWRVALERTIGAAVRSRCD